MLLALLSFLLCFSFLRRFLCHFQRICLFFFHLRLERFMIVFGKSYLKMLVTPRPRFELGSQPCSKDKRQLTLPFETNASELSFVRGLHSWPLNYRGLAIDFRYFYLRGLNIFKPSALIFSEVSNKQGIRFPC